MTEITQHRSNTLADRYDVESQGGEAWWKPTRGALITVVFALTATLILWTSGDGLGALWISDSSEYAISAARVIEGSGYTLGLDGSPHPPRYPPGLPLAFLAPVYLIAGTSELGQGIYAVLASGVLVLLLLRWLCRRCLSEGVEVAAWLALAIVAALRSFRETAEFILADVPFLLTGVVACVAFVEAWRHREVRWFLIGGLATGLAFSIRLTGLAFVMPFVVVAWHHRKKSPWPIVAAVAPVAGSVIAVALYNASTFGSPTFTGYEYWLGAYPEVYRLGISRVRGSLFALLLPFTAVPFGSGYLWTPKAAVMALVMIVPGALGFACRLRRPEVWERTRPVLIFLILGAMPVTVFHLVFPPSSRFHLPAQVLWFTLGSVWVTALVVPRIRGLSSLVAAGAVTMSLGAFGPWSGSGRLLYVNPEATLSPYYQVEALAAADDVVPDDGVLVGALSGVIVDRVFSHHTERQFVPLNPFSGYASFFVGRAGEERAGTFAFTGWNAERIDDLLTSGRRVFFLRQGLADGLEFEKRYELTPVALPPYPDSLLMELRSKWRPQLRVEFAGPDESASPYLRDGWNLEESGRALIRWKWTLGHEATMVLPLDADGPVMVQMSVGPSQAGHQGVTVVANGQTVASLVLENTFRQYSFVIPFAAVREFNQLELKFLQPDATSPQSSGPNTIETTELGMPFLWLSLSFCDTGECQPPPITLPFTIAVGESTARPWLRSGWHSGEVGGGASFAWSDGRVSVMSIRLPSGGDIQMDFEAHPFEFRRSPRQRISIFVNDTEVDEVRLDDGLRRYRVTLPEEVLSVSPSTIEFRYAYARAPRDVLRGSRDKRLLAVAWYSISFRRLPP